MDLSLAGALERLYQARPTAVVDIMNMARPPESYLGATLLPEVPSLSNFGQAGRMIMRPTVATPTALNSSFNKGGSITGSTFSHKTFKFTMEVPLGEETLEELQQLANFSRSAPQAIEEQLIETLLNFTEKMLLQSHLDAAELVRWEAMSEGVVTWDYNGVVLEATYEIKNKNTTRSGNDKYSGSASKFWDDVRWAQTKLRRNVYGYFMNPNTYMDIVGNEVNKTVQVGGSVESGRVTLSKYRSTSSSDLERDGMYTIPVFIVSGETEIFNPSTPGENKLRPFLKDGKMVVVSNNSNASGFKIGLGSGAEMPTQAIGFTHLGPTTEGNGQPGRWGKIFRPQDSENNIVGRSASRFIPVIEAPEKIAICTTEMSA